VLFYGTMPLYLYSSPVCKSWPCWLGYMGLEVLSSGHDTRIIGYGAPFEAGGWCCAGSPTVLPPAGPGPVDDVWRWWFMLYPACGLALEGPSRWLTGRLPGPSPCRVGGDFPLMLPSGR